MAADGVDYNVDGLAEVLGNFEALEYDIKRKGGRFALRRAAQVLRDQARANAELVDDPMTESNIAENIAVKWAGKTFKRTGDMVFNVGVRGGANSGATFHWRFLEFGTSKMRAQPIFRQVPGQAGQQAVDEFIKQYSKKIERVLKAANRRASE